MNYTQDQLQQLNRVELQTLAKQHDIKANIKSDDIINQLINNAALTQNEATTNLTKYQTTDTTINHDNDVRKNTVKDGFDSEDQVMKQVNTNEGGSRINDFYNVYVVNKDINNETTHKLTKENKQKWLKPTYKKSLLQRIKDNPPIRSNDFQGVDYFVNKCVITIPENNTKLADKIRQFLSFEIEKITVDIPANLLPIYESKKVTVNYDCEDQVLLNLITEKYNNNERSLWNITHNPDNYSLDVSLKQSVYKLNFKQLNTMYKKSNKYYESISHDTVFSILDMLVMDKSELVKISRTPLIIAFNILLSLDPIVDYYQFIKQIRVDTVNGDLMSCISLPTIDVKTSRVIMIPDLNLFNESINLSWDFNSCIEHKDIQTATIARYNGTKVVKNNILATRYKSDNKQADTDFTEHSSRTYLSNMFLSICSDNYELVGSRLLFELVSKGQNQYGDQSIAYLQTTSYDSYYDTSNGGIKHSKDVITTEVNKSLLNFCKLHGIKQNKVLGRIAIQTVRHSMEYLGLLYINKHGYLSYKSFDSNAVNLHPEIKQYLSLHGLRPDRFVSPSKILVNWKQLLNVNVIPQSKAGNVSYEITDNYPYTVI
jgi:hypothetical protein